MWSQTIHFTLPLLWPHIEGLLFKLHRTVLVLKNVVPSPQGFFSTLEFLRYIGTDRGSALNPRRRNRHH